MALYKKGDRVFLTNPHGRFGYYGIPDECWDRRIDYVISEVKNMTSHGQNYSITGPEHSGWHWGVLEEMLESVGGPW